VGQAGKPDRAVGQVAGDGDAGRFELTKAEKATVEADLRTAETQLAALGTLAERARRSVGSCPRCSAQVTGHDLLTAGLCPHCGQPLSELTAVRPAGPTLDQRKVLMLMGTLGAVLAIAYLASK